MLKSVAKVTSYLLLFVMLQAVVQSGFAAYAHFTGIDVSKFINNTLLLSSLIANVLALVILTTMYRIQNKKIILEVHLEIIPAKMYILPVICAVTYSIVLYHLGITNNVPLTQSIEYFSAYFAGSGEVLWGLSVIILGPVVEEVIFRGLILPCVKCQQSATVAITISSLLFGAVHILAGGFVLALFAAFAGVIFGIIFEKTHSLLPAIVAHIFANLVDAVLTFS